MPDHPDERGVLEVTCPCCEARLTVDPVSGAEIARVAGLSRAAVWKQIEELRTRGYVIDAHPNRGYRLIDRPDRP